MLKLAKKIARKILNIPLNIKGKINFAQLKKNDGYCCICEQQTEFIIYNDWLRDYYKCKKCDTIPRNRALANALTKYASNWEKLIVHESSPSGELSKYLKRKCKGYSGSQYFSDVPRGQYKGEFRSEDLSKLTFEDNSIDILITSDVFEHVYEPAKAFKEIARVLKPGGMHIFTMPWYPELKTTVQRTKLSPDGTDEFLMEPIYHGNPIGGGKGSIVTFDWGLDFPDFIFKNGGMNTIIYLEVDRKKGLDGKFLEVFISRKADGK